MIALVPIIAADPAPDYLPKNWWEWLVNQGLGVTVLCVGLFFAGKLLLLAQAKIAALTDTRAALQDARIVELKAEVADVRKENQELKIRSLAQQQEIDECREDRRDLRERVDRLTKDAES